MTTLTKSSEDGRINYYLNIVLKSLVCRFVPRNIGGPGMGFTTLVIICLLVLGCCFTNRVSAEENAAVGIYTDDDSQG